MSTSRVPQTLLKRVPLLCPLLHSMPAHNLLWEGCEMSASDLGARLAIVPMSQVGWTGRVGLLRPPQVGSEAGPPASAGAAAAPASPWCASTSLWPLVALASFAGGSRPGCRGPPVQAAGGAGRQPHCRHCAAHCGGGAGPRGGGGHLVSELDRRRTAGSCSD